MRAILFKDNRLFEIQKPTPIPAENEVLIRTSIVGICNTDLELLRGYHAFEGIAGHEFVGTIEKAPCSHTGLEGKRVIADINCGCGECYFCKRGNERHCPQRNVIGLKGKSGAFAEYITVPMQNIHILDEDLDIYQAVFAEPLAAALEISQQIHLTNHTRLLVLGDGKLGLLIALALKYYSPQLILIGKHKDKLKIAADQTINTYQIDTSNKPLLQSLNLLKSFEVVIEATGRADGINTAMELIRPEGTIVLKTTSHALTEIDLSQIVVNEIQLIGSRCGDLDLALFFLKNRMIDVYPLIESIYQFSEFQKALDHANTKGSKKVLVRFDH